MVSKLSNSISCWTSFASCFDNPNDSFSMLWKVVWTVWHVKTRLELNHASWCTRFRRNGQGLHLLNVSIKTRTYENRWIDMVGLLFVQSTKVITSWWSCRCKIIWKQSFKSLDRWRTLRDPTGCLQKFCIVFAALPQQSWSCDVDCHNRDLQ